MDQTLTRTTTARRRAARFSWLAVLVAGVVAYVVVLRVMVRTQNLNFFPSLLLIGAITVPVTVLAFAETGGRARPGGPAVRGWLVATVAIAGGVVGTVTAGTLEYDTLRTLGTVPMLFVGVIEEFAKLIVPLVLFLVLRPKDPRGGVVVGVAAGTGFAVLETMGYGFQELLRARSIAAVDGELLLRGLLSPACHIAWTGMTVAVLWRIPTARHRVRAVWAFVATYAAAVALHATWDSSGSQLVHLVVAVVGLVVLFVFVHRAHRREAARGTSAAPAPDPR
ncbi:PrsW family glutamic-type intramembrane protease [Kineococcus rhizosphaerae]|uniref:RsiW-degrading membrane proteinase PrsW (M82 family) n=1 Tax=Kineococcus rhizosphaerae TaxID=559628 RepID=A0A2T0R4B0_9ACTN|nr:PrsW family glutamic-type intramembrane protease [Kineococcus rhizosphaerae]PRY15193.1 RsiW-degrading membrane proteinase PrsW (M82 family) [Kineococcus rhizosphaerae]